MLLAALALTVSLTLGAFMPLFAQTESRSQLPATQPGLSRDEGVFLVTDADDGSRLVYFIAQNARHSTLPGDLQREQQLNSLWPVRLATREEVLAFPEALPVGIARTGMLDVQVAEELMPVAEAPVVADAPVVAEAPVALPAPVAAEPAAAEFGTTYVLKPGDNLTRLSTRFATTIPAILAANGLTNANRIYIGQALVIPGTAASPEPILATPPAPSIASDEPDAVADSPATGDVVTYTVKPGDSAIHIARQFDVDVDSLLAANAIFNRNRVYVGQILNIPGA